MLYFILLFFIVPVAWIAYTWVYDQIIFPKDLVALREAINQHQISDALSIVKKMPESKQGNPEILFYLATIQIYQKQWYLALYNLEKILILNEFPGPITQLKVRLQKMDIYKILKKPRDVMKECQKIMTIEPNHKEANEEMGSRLFELKNYSAAKKFLEKIAPYSNQIKVHEMLFDTYMVEEAYPHALSKIDQIIEMGKKPICRILNKKAKVLFKLEAFKEALEIITDLDNTYKKPTDLKLIEGICHYRLGQYENSLNIFMPILKVFIDEFPDLVLEARYDYSRLLIFKKSLNEAISQMNYIESTNRTYKNNSTRLRLYQQIYQNDKLRNFFNNYPDEKRNLETILEIFNRKGKWMIKKSAHGLPQWHLVRLEDISRHRPLNVLLSFNQSPFKKKTIRKIKEVLVDKDNKNDLICLSLFKMSIKEENELNVLFKDSKFFYEEAILEQIAYEDYNKNTGPEKPKLQADKLEAPA